MAKYECHLVGDFDEILKQIESGILNGSISASLEDRSDYNCDGVRCAVRVFERYSMLGGNRLSMNVTLIGKGENLFLSAITSGGSKAMFFKINTLGEGVFLDQIRQIALGFQKA
ncbi:MAG: DUF6054 family protein [Christensenellales bacterium]|jgi:hypothetical protein|nr:hypothetical protein [Clostridiales bacterium]